MSRSSKVNVDNVKSGFEVDTFKQLRSNQRKFGLKELTYETEEIPYYIQFSYVPDFCITRKDGSKLYIEAKGWLRPEDKRKMKAVKAQYPNLDIRILFQKNNRFPRSKTTYGDWATRIGYPYAIGTIPEDWLT